MKIYNLALLLLLQFSCQLASEFPQASHPPDSLQTQKTGTAETSIIVFRSADGGQTWQDISNGLPAAVTDENGASRDVFFTDDNGLYLTDGNGIYHSEPNCTGTFWTKEIFPDEHAIIAPGNTGIDASISPGNTGIYAFNYRGGILQKANGTNVWSPVFTNFQEKRIRTVFETAGGTVFIRSDNGLYKSTNNGKTWKQVLTGGVAGNLVESAGVLMATSGRGIIRSTDDGENWELVISEGGVGIDVARIKGGFAAISFSTASNTRRIRTTYDGGKTWQLIDAGLQSQNIIDLPLRPINAGNPAQGSADSVWHPNGAALPAQRYITSIIQVGENFFCGHSDGIYRSSDKGKTWTLVLPSIKGKMFKVSVSGNVIYAIQRELHC